MKPKDKYKISFVCRLDKIIQQNNYIITLLEAAIDDANLVSSLQAKLQSTNSMMRQLEYENYFLKKERNGNGKSDT